MKPVQIVDMGRVNPSESKARCYAFYCRDCSEVGEAFSVIELAYRQGEHHAFEKCPYRSSDYSPADEPGRWGVVGPSV